MNNSPKYIREQFMKYPRLYAHGIQVFGSDEEFTHWCTLEIPRLGNNKPIELLHSKQGREEIHGALYALEHGMF